MSEPDLVYSVENQAKNTQPQATAALRSFTAESSAKEDERIPTGVPATSGHRGHHLARSTRLRFAKSSLPGNGEDAATASGHSGGDESGTLGRLAGRRGPGDHETKYLYARDAATNGLIHSPTVSRSTERTFCPMPMNWRELTRARRE